MVSVFLAFIVLSTGPLSSASAHYLVQCFLRRLLCENIFYISTLLVLVKLVVGVWHWKISFLSLSLYKNLSNTEANR